MMAHDSTPTRPELSHAAIDTLRSALQRYLEDSIDVAALQAALRAVAEDARERNVNAEQLLVALKDVWYSLPKLQSVTSTEDHNRLLQRVVTLCIREYYSSS